MARDPWVQRFDENADEDDRYARHLEQECADRGAEKGGRCARDSDWCDGVICEERGLGCPNSDASRERGILSQISSNVTDGGMTIEEFERAVEEGLKGFGGPKQLPPVQFVLKGRRTEKTAVMIETAAHALVAGQQVRYVCPDDEQAHEFNQKVIARAAEIREQLAAGPPPPPPPGPAEPPQIPTLRHGPCVSGWRLVWRWIQAVLFVVAAWVLAAAVGLAIFIGVAWALGNGS